MLIPMSSPGISTNSIGNSDPRSSILFTLHELYTSSLRRGLANLLCIVQSLTDDPRRESIQGLVYNFKGTWYSCQTCHKHVTFKGGASRDLNAVWYAPLLLCEIWSIYVSQSWTHALNKQSLLCEICHSDRKHAQIGRCIRLLLQISWQRTNNT